MKPTDFGVKSGFFFLLLFSFFSIPYHCARVNPQKNTAVEKRDVPRRRLARVYVLNPVLSFHLPVTRSNTFAK